MGLDNYTRALRDPVFIRSLSNVVIVRRCSGCR